MLVAMVVGGLGVSFESGGGLIVGGVDFASVLIKFVAFSVGWLSEEKHICNERDEYVIDVRCKQQPIYIKVVP